MTRKNLLTAFRKQGINEDRFEFITYEKVRTNHLLHYNLIDIALDPIPYNGTTTTCDALWMGVPVLTLVGQSHRQRVSYAILKNIGIDDTIAFSEGQFVDLGNRLANDLDRLEELRSRVAVGIRQSILCTPKKFTKQFEDTIIATFLNHIK